MTLVSDCAELRGEVELHRRLAALYAAITSGQLSRNPLTGVVEAAARALDGEAGVLMVDDDHGRWHVSAAWNMPIPAARREWSRIADAAIAKHRLVATDGHQQRLGEDSLRRGAAATVLAIPLSADGAAGSCLLLSYDTPRCFAPAEVELVGQVAAGVRSALENALVFEQQQAIAATLQESLRHPLPHVPQLELGRVAQGAEQPAFVGGDFSDVIVLDDAHVSVLIGDVGGRGVSAAVLAETVRAAMSAFSLLDPSPAFVLSKANELLVRREGDAPFVTALSCLIDLGSGEVCCASAGHPAPVLLGESRCTYIEVPFGLPLGLQRGEYGGINVNLRTNEGLVFYTGWPQ